MPVPDDIDRLIQLSESLTERLATETAAIAGRRAHQIVDAMAETQSLANAYRRETARLRQDPSVLKAVAVDRKQALIQATERFDAVLRTHADTVEAARIVSEGLLQTLAHEVVATRPTGRGYGAAGQAISSDGRAVALNRVA